MTTKKVMLSAAQPTKNITLGNYIGAIRNWVELQKDYDNYIFAVDLHSITARQAPDELRKQTYYIIAAYIAAGIDPNKSLLFAQSHVPQHAELAWVLNCFSYMGELGRMTQYKDKSAKQGENIPVGIFTYPILMAADILLYRTDLVPVGQDQKQHVELTRDVAIRMNNIYAKDLFKIPEVFIPPVGGRIMSLQDPTAKMSKSDPDPTSAIYLGDADDQIIKKFKKAVTDSGTEVTDDDSKPGVRNLLEIQAALTGRSRAEIVKTYAGKMYGHLKLETADIVIAKMGPIREEANRLFNDQANLDSILKRGAEKAREKAQHQLNAVYQAIGFIARH